MMVNRTTCLFLYLFCCCTMSQAQQFSYEMGFDVMVDGRTMSMPFAGGLNGSQFSYIDLDEDGTEELVVFDRSNDLPYVFEQARNNYVVNFDKSMLLPSNISNWLIFADYDGDGRKDIFTHTSSGVRVIRKNDNSWMTVADPIRTKSGDIEINLLVTGSDYPGIGDYDNDGDVDILVFDFALGDQIIFYQNMSGENNDPGGLSFEKTSDAWGQIKECFCNSYRFQGMTCDTPGGRMEHAAAKALVLYKNDIYLGVKGCPELIYFPNNGTFDNPSFNSFTAESLSVTDFGDYAIPFFGDFTGDGTDDMMVSNNITNDGYYLDNGHTIRLFEGPEFVLRYDNFLQNEMIDHGEQAYPLLFDWDGDGDLDLFIGNKGELHEGIYYGTLFYYENTGTRRKPGFELKSRDFGQLSQYQFVHINPSFFDLNRDGKKDLLISAGKVDKLFAHIQYLEGIGEENFAPPVEWPLSFSRRDLPLLRDMDNDGDLDVLLGKNFGSIEYHENNGSDLAPSLQLVTKNFLGTEPDGDRINPSLAFFDVDDDPEPEILKSDSRGILEIYQAADNIEEVITKNWYNDLKGEILPFKLGVNNPMSFGDIYGTGDIYGMIGDFRGGVKMIKMKSEIPKGELEVYPNPVFTGQELTLYSRKQQLLWILDVSGKKISEVLLKADEELKLQLPTLNQGLYIVKSTFDTAKFYVR